MGKGLAQEIKRLRALRGIAPKPNPNSKAAIEERLRQKNLAEWNAAREEYLQGGNVVPLFDKAGNVIVPITSENSEGDLEARRRSAHSQRLRKQQEQAAEALKKQEQELFSRQHAILAVEKRAQGKPEVLHGSVVTVKDIKGDEVIKFYLRRPQQWNGLAGKMQYVDTPPDGSEAVSADSAIGRALAGRFVGDGVEVTLRHGDVITYLIMGVKMQTGKPKQHNPKHQKSTAHESECKIYSGRGKHKPAGDSEGLDGSKYIGFMAREGGQWGSFSMHDDYGDEADAEGRDYDERFDTGD